MSKKNTAKIIVAAAGGLVANEKIQKALFGCYSDGSPRSFPDCLEGEILSPKDRQRMLYGKKLKKNRKKKSKNKKKYKTDYKVNKKRDEKKKSRRANKIRFE